jgi:drug/metabolite transporter (DMT)-like permease
MPPRTLLLTALAMLAFAGNSLLCRLALRETEIDAASFTAVRLTSGALMLAVLLRLRSVSRPMAGSWPGALALFTYAAAFSFAYLHLDTGVGALLLFGAVQLSMLLWGLWRGERLPALATLGTLLAGGGLLFLLLPGASAPPLLAALLMLLAGSAWGAYSLLGRGQGDPLAVTAGNFLRATALGLLLAVPLFAQLQWDAAGLFYAVLSGALTSGIGYAIWYSALPGLRASQAATVQLSVPILAALAGSLVLGEALSLRLMLSAVAVLGGIALVLGSRQPQQKK